MHLAPDQDYRVWREYMHRLVRIYHSAIAEKQLSVQGVKLCSSFTPLSEIIILEWWFQRDIVL
jgi:hypothetical protein